MYFTKMRLNGLSTIDLPIIHAKPSDPYILKNVDGLGPTEVDVSIIDTLNAGGYYQGRRPHSKEVVIFVGLNPNFGVEQTASDLRQELYGLLTPGGTDSVKIEIMEDDISIAYTTGYIKKFEIVPFSQTPEVQITFACIQQYWTTPSVIYVDPGNKATPVISNAGTAPSGFHMEVMFTSSVNTWVLTDSANRKMQIDFPTYGLLNQFYFVAGDILIIDTIPGERGIWLEKGGVKTNIIYTLSADSSWLMLHGGNNQFYTNLQSFNWGDVYYHPQYWGI